MEQLTERINAIKRHYGCTGRGFAQAVSLKPAAVINYLSGRQLPSLEFVFAILSKYTDVSAEWLLRGEGTMLKSESAGTSETEQKLRADLMVKDGIIQELRTIILEKKGQTL
jgi:transcriptional regulator with XRE-family HTH domain